MIPIQLQARKLIIEQSKRANVGHIGSALSVIDILLTLYQKILTLPSDTDQDRDRFILSKGHAALALYCCLFLNGLMSKETLNSYCGNETKLAVHPEHIVPYIDFSTGSLGQGFTMGVGAALAAKLQKSDRRIFILVSDAECNEGVVWESIMFCAHHQLSNLILLVDQNNQQAFGYTKDVLSVTPIVDKFLSFGWDASECDGHNISELTSKINSFNFRFGPPHVIIAKTTFGKGISFMQNKIKWHYMPLNDEEYIMANNEIDKIPCD